MALAPVRSMVEVIRTASTAPSLLTGSPSTAASGAAVAGVYVAPPRGSLANSAAGPLRSITITIS